MFDISLQFTHAQQLSSCEEVFSDRPTSRVCQVGDHRRVLGVGDYTELVGSQVTEVEKVRAMRGHDDLPETCRVEQDLKYLLGNRRMHRGLWFLDPKYGGPPRLIDGDEQTE